MDTTTQSWKPPQKVEELFSNTKNQTWSSNSATAGPRFESKLPTGDKPYQLYSLATPNGQKVSILLEELGVKYDPHIINIMKGDQFSSGFVEINPNSKIPALVDTEEKVNVFESCSILLYLAEKEKKFLPTSLKSRAEVMNWLFWQAAGQGPFTGQYGHFMVYAPKDALAARDYGVARYGMEVQRLCSVLDKHLEDKLYMVDNEYSIADIAIFPWFQQLRKGYNHESGVKGVDFLSIEDNYVHAVAWADRIAHRPAVQTGMTVCSSSSAPIKAMEEKKENNNNNEENKEEKK